MMSPSDDEKRIVAMVDSFTKTVARNFSRNLKRAKANAEKHYSDEPVDYLLETLSHDDRYPSDHFVLYADELSCVVHSETIDREMDEARNEMEVITGLIQRLIDENATRKMDQNDYRKRYDGYVSRYAALESRMDSLEKERKTREFKYDIFSGFLFELGEIHELPLAFDDRLFYQLVDYATVYSDGRVVFSFRNGTEITTEM